MKARKLVYIREGLSMIKLGLYVIFRKNIYQGQIQKRLKKKGGVMVVVRNKRRNAPKFRRRRNCIKKEEMHTVINLYND
jgi:hypothetical protein